MSQTIKSLSLGPAGPQQHAENLLTLEDLPSDPLLLIFCKVMGHNDPAEDLDMMFGHDSGLGAQRRELFGTLHQVRAKGSLTTEGVPFPASSALAAHSTAPEI
jgi:hypothetical protein